MFSVDEQESPFTVAENELFEKCYTEGYDLTTDLRYNEWLRAHHPDATIVAHLPQVTQGTLVPFTAGITTSHFLQPPTPPSKKFSQSAKTSSRVLTRAESRRFQQEKEEKKREKEAQKEQRKKDNEERKRIRSEMKEQTRLEKEQRAAAKKQKDSTRGKCIRM